MSSLCELFERRACSNSSTSFLVISDGGFTSGRHFEAVEVLKQAMLPLTKTSHTPGGLISPTTLASVEGQLLLKA